MDILEECMKMTSFGGQAKSLAVEAMGIARHGNISGANEKMTEALEYLEKSHEAHTNLLGIDADEEETEMRITLFMVHAADHLSSASTVCMLAEEIIHLYEQKEKNLV